MNWNYGYQLIKSAYNFEELDPDSSWIQTVMTLGDVSMQTTHMFITESYPSTFDSIQGNYS